MYIPKAYQNQSPEEALSFIQTFPFGILANQQNQKMVATHLPFVAEKEGDRLVLFSHIAKANSQLNQKSEEEVLTIFSEPHSYISPSHYEKTDSVPTWNYVSAHLYGKVVLLHEKDDQLLVLEKMIRFFEKEYESQWKSLSQKYKTALLAEIIAFKIEVHEIQLQEKLSQDRNKKERESIIHKTSKSDKENEKTIGIFMQKKEKTSKT